MTQEIAKKFRDALAHSKGEFAKRSFNKILELSGGTPHDQNSLIVFYAGDHYLVRYPEGDVVFWDEEKGKVKEGTVEITTHILILQYLTEVCGVQPTGRWISFRELPGGNNHFGTFKLEAMEPLAQHFGNSPEKFSEICQILKGRKLDMGDLAYAIPALPKLEVALVLWLADEEFPAQANVLYDANASQHLNTEALEVMVINLVEKMVAWAKEHF